MGGSIETVKVVYEDDLENPIITPNLKPNEWEVDYEYINDYIGINLNVDEMIKCFQKVRLDAKKSKQDSNILKVQVPAYRNDIMHDVDFVEEVAMGYGYKNIPKVINKKGFGQYHPIQELLQHSRDIMIGSGCIEMVNNILISQKDHKAFNLPFDEKHNITPANPVSVHYNAIRTWLLVGLMNNLKFNRSAEKPFRLFEVGDVIHLDTTQDTMSRRVPHLACIVHSDSADYTVIKSILDHYFRTLGVFTDVKFKPVKHDSFIPGRTAEIFYKSKAIGIIGEIHPQIIINFGLEYPTSAFEINLTPFLEKKSDG
jgi:phenylalanyl-tRNA synthetase beta chain